MQAYRFYLVLNIFFMDFANVTLHWSKILKNSRDAINTISINKYFREYFLS